MATRDTIELLIAVIADGAGAALMVRLLAIYRQYYGRRRTEGRYYLYFIWSVIGMAIIDLALRLFALYQVDLEPGGLGELSAADAAIVVIDTTLWLLNLFLTTLFVFFWLRYVAWRLYPNRDYARRRFWRGVFPLLLSGAGAVAGFVEVLFNKDAGFVCVGALFLFLAIRAFYFIHSIRRINLYKKQNGYMKFFNARGFLIPVIVGVLLQDFTDFEVNALGAAVGATLLYASISREEHYLDAETGLYNTNYREYLTDLIRRRKYAPCSALMFRTGGEVSPTALAKALKEQLPKDCEAVRRSDNEVVVLTQVGEKAPLTMVMEDVKAAVEVEASCVLRKKDETPEAFLERVL